MRKRALITGATGFVGTNLIKELSKQHWQVEAIVRKNSIIEESIKKMVTPHVYNGGVNELISIFKKSKPDVVFHLASLFIAEHESNQIDALINSNILFSAQLLEAMKSSKCRCFINTGTAWQNFRKKEFDPVNLYASTKQALEAILAYYHDAHGFSCITLKLFDNYGPNDGRNKIISVLIKTSQNDETIKLSPGNQEIDISFIDDIVASFIEAANFLITNQDSIINSSYFISGERFTLKSLIKKIESSLKIKIKAKFGVKPYRKREVMKLIKLNKTDRPPWENKLKKIKFEEGIKKLL